MAGTIFGGIGVACCAPTGDAMRSGNKTRATAIAAIETNKIKDERFTIRAFISSS